MKTRLKLKYKLFAILFSASALLIAGMFYFTQKSFEHGLNRYVDDIEMNRLGTMCRVLEEKYAEKKSWDFLRGNRSEWLKLKKKSLRKLRYQPRREYRLHRMREGILRPGQDFKGKGKKRPWDKNQWRSPLNRKQYPTVILLDKNKHPIFGKVSETEEVRLMSVKYRNNIVGWLGMVPPESFIEAEELLFFKDQSRTFVLISVLMLLLSIIIAIWAAFYLERPIKVLTRGTRSLAAGEYHIRIPAASGDELGQLSKDFNVLAKTLEENEKSRKQWVQDIAHELRTPLTLLSGELEAVQDGVRKLTPETLGLLQGDIARLIRLVSDLNELSKTDLGALSYKKEEVDLVEILHRVTDRFHEEFDSRKIDLEDLTREEKPLPVFADSERLSQLFGNLLQNSLEYTHTPGNVKLWIHREGGKATVNIEDSAPGVPEAELPKLFERFYRLEPSRNRKFGGTGLGLCICRNIVNAHQGEIAALPSPTGGILIKIKLPTIT